MNGKRSREALLNFLDYLSRKGLMNKTTAASRKAVANKVLGILDPEEAEDVTTLNVDDLLSRFSNIAGSNYTPESLGTYRSRLKSSLEDFRNYLDNPITFRPSLQPSVRRGAEKAKAVSTENEVERDRTTPRSQSFVSAPPTSVSILPIPIRADLTVQVQGLPFDLTIQEANKIANVIKAMASTE